MKREMSAMTDEIKSDERRAHRRYMVKTQAFAALTSHCLIGQIKNISKGGISFICLESLKPDSPTFKIEIFTPDNRFHLRDIPFKIVSEADAEDPIPSSSIQKKTNQRCVSGVDPQPAGTAGAFSESLYRG
jgi:hypothetical protein